MATKDMSLDSGEGASSPSGRPDNLETERPGRYSLAPIMHSEQEIILELFREYDGTSQVDRIKPLDDGRH